jgi:hypothetical protein
MSQLNAILFDFLGTVEPAALGGTPPKQHESDAAGLIERLERQALFNNRTVIAIVASYLFLLLVSSALVLLHHDDASWIATFLGGNVLVLTTIGAKLQNVWREKSYIDMLVAILPSLTPAEAVRVIKTFYLEQMEKARPTSQ